MPTHVLDPPLARNARRFRAVPLVVHRRLAHQEPPPPSDANAVASAPSRRTTTATGSSRFGNRGLIVTCAGGFLSSIPDEIRLLLWDLGGHVSDTYSNFE